MHIHTIIDVLTIEEGEGYEIRKSNENGQMLHVFDLESDQYGGGEHDSCDGETLINLSNRDSDCIHGAFYSPICVCQGSRALECGHEYDGGYHHYRDDRQADIPMSNNRMYAHIQLAAGI